MKDVMALIAQIEVTDVLIKYRKIYVIFIKIIIIVAGVKMLKNTVRKHVDYVDHKKVVQVIAIIMDSVTMVFVLVMTDIQEEIVVREKVMEIKMEAVQITVATKEVV